MLYKLTPVLALVKRYTILITHLGAAEQIQAAADRRIDPPLAQLIDSTEDLDSVNAARISRRNGRKLPEKDDQSLINPLAFPFDSDGVNEKFGTRPG